MLDIAHSMSVSSIRRRIYSMALQEQCDSAVLDLLIPDLVPIEHEDALWDFKQTILLDPSVHKGGTDYAADCCELVKDIVAFHNTYGGYIVIGVTDKTKQIVPFNFTIDVDLLKARIKSDTNASIDFTFKRLTYGSLSLGLILIPRRRDGIAPLQFRRDAKPNSNGTKCYKSGDIYCRDDASSAPARGAESLALLFSDVRRAIAAPTEVKAISITDNNLRARDPGLIQFVGRDEDLDKLWRWLVDRFNPVRLISGVGGVGKTTLVREFAEEILDRSPLGFERVIWLTAKRKHWDAAKGKKVEAEHENFPHFDTPNELFRQLLFELGYLETDIDADWMRTDFIEKLVEALTLTPSFVVVDDLDTLEPDDQTDVFQALITILSQTVPKAVATSRAIVTARLNIGASPAQMMRVEGFNEAEFIDYIRMVMKELDFTLSLKRDSKLFKKFYSATEGSPLFASSILRIVARGGDALDACLNKWKGASGEEVRRFAFERELSQLTDSQLRTLYVICCLETCSFIELREITRHTQQLLEDDLQRLRDFHLVAQTGMVETGGMNYRIPNNIALLSDLMKERVKDHSRIEQACARLRKQAGGQTDDVGGVIRRVVAYWDRDQPSEALQIAQSASNSLGRKHPDIECILGRAYLRAAPPDPQRADVIFRNADNLGCERPELLGLWIEARAMRGDWRGVIELGERGLDSNKASKYAVAVSSAYLNIGDAEFSDRKYQSAIDNYLRSGREADKAFAQNRASGAVHQLNEIRRRAFDEAIRASKVIHSDSDSAVEIWNACFGAFKCYVRTQMVIQTGLEYLMNWARHVTNVRENVNISTRDKMFEKQEELMQMRDACLQKEWDDPKILREIEDALLEINALTVRYSGLAEARFG